MDGDFFKTVYESPQISEADYEIIAHAHQKIAVKNGQIILDEGEIAHEYYVIEEGLFRSFVVDYNGKEVTTEFYSPGELLIESFSLFHRSPAMEKYQALSDGSVWKID